MRIVVALGGNALLERGEPMTAEHQRANTKRAASAIGKLVKAGHQVVVTHGNGPQVGLLALQSSAYDAETAYPLDVLGAETEGMIGYLIEQELENVLEPDAKVVTLLTQVVVDAQDPAFNDPTKPIGPIYSENEANRLAQARGWTVKADGAQFRRVVPSPEPQRIPDVDVIRLLLEHEVTVICAGGGGIPVVRQTDGSLVGVEAVIDKDAASALLAEQIGADALLLLTDVEAVYLYWGQPEQIVISKATPNDLEKLEFAPGSMAPKVAATCRFVDRTNGLAGIGRLEDALDILEGRTGTLVSSRAEYNRQTLH